MVDLHSRRYVPALLLLCLFVLAGCARTRSIEALPPRPVVVSEAGELLAAGLARLEVRLSVPEQPEREEVEAMRLRVTGVRFRNSDGTWRSFPAAGGLLRIDSREKLDRSVLSTQVDPALYDSVEVTFGDLYVEFDANAGGPIVSETAPTARRALHVRTQAGKETVVEVRLDPEASLIRDSDCRWHFLPFVTVEVD